MFKCDYHTHTRFSFDGSPLSTPDAICEAAIAQGITHLAITDHFESNWKICDGISEYDADGAYESISKAKKKYKDKLIVAYGIEIGQANQCPQEAKKLLSSYKFDFVLASVHNLEGMRDFFFFDFAGINDDEYISRLYEKNIRELCDVIDTLDRIDSVAHITYMRRYLELAGKTHDFTNHAASLSKLFAKMVSRDIALEVNVSTLWKGLGFAMPDRELLSLYRDCGGRLVTIGTDSHSPENVGGCVDKGFDLLKSVGLNSVLIVENGEKRIVNI